MPLTPRPAPLIIPLPAGQTDPNKGANAKVWRGFRLNLNKAIMAAWPEIFGPRHPIFRVTQVQRVPWRHLIDTKRLEAPWVVVQVPQSAPVAGWGAANRVWRPRVTVYYVTQEDAPQQGGTDNIAGFLEDRLAALESVLTGQAGQALGFQIMGDFTYDASEDNPATTGFLSSNIHNVAASLAFTCQFGYIVPLATLASDGLIQGDDVQMGRAPDPAGIWGTPAP